MANPLDLQVYHRLPTYVWIGVCVFLGLLLIGITATSTLRPKVVHYYVYEPPEDEFRQVSAKELVERRARTSAKYILDFNRYNVGTNWSKVAAHLNPSLSGHWTNLTENRSFINKVQGEVATTGLTIYDTLIEEDPDEERGWIAKVKGDVIVTEITSDVDDEGNFNSETKTYEDVVVGINFKFDNPNSTDYTIYGHGIVFTDGSNNGPFRKRLEQWLNP